MPDRCPESQTQPSMLPVSRLAWHWGDGNLQDGGYGSQDTQALSQPAGIWASPLSQPQGTQQVIPGTVSYRVPPHRFIFSQRVGPQ